MQGRDASTYDVLNFYPRGADVYQYIEGSVSNPAAGANFSLVVNTSDRFRLRSVHFTLAIAADDNGESLQVAIKTKSGDTIWETAGTGNLTVSKTYTVSLIAGPGAPGNIVALGENVFSGPLPDISLPAGSVFASTLQGLAADDAISAIYYSAYVGDEFEHLKWLEQIAGSIGD